MKFTVNQSELSSVLSWVSRVVPQHPTHPILSNILMNVDAENQRLNLTAFDLSLGIQASVLAAVKGGGTLAIPAKLFNDIISRLPGGEITIEDGEESIITIASGSGQYQVRGKIADEYPELPVASEGDVVYLSTESLISGLRGVLFAVSSDETKQMLTGVNLRIEKGIIKVAATDGHRLAVVEAENLNEPDIEDLSESENKVFETTIPAKALREIERMVALGDKEEAIALRFDESQVVFELGEQRLVTRKLEGAYPAYNQLIPKSFLNQISLDRKVLIGSLERIAVLTSQKNNIVKCTVDHANQQISLSVEAADVGNGIESLPAQISGGEPKELAFNVKYLLEGLKVMGSTEILLQLNQATSPVIATPLGGMMKMICLVMTAQLRN